MKPGSVFADQRPPIVDPASRRAAALARIRILPHRPSRAEVLAEAHRIRAAEGLPFREALHQARQRAKKGTL